MQYAVVPVTVATALVEGQKNLRRYALQLCFDGFSEGRIGSKLTIRESGNFDALCAEERSGSHELVDANP